tara:strand:+ start:515 stop:1024 length:510 start_codon:yes stop_codon:yes gene_type:complete
MKRLVLICIPLLFSYCDPVPVNPPLLDYEIYNTISIKNPEDAIQDGFYRNYRFTMYGISGEYTVPTTGDTLFTTNRHIRRTNLTDGFSYSISLLLIYPLFPGPSPFQPIAMATPGCIDVEILTYLNDSLFDSQIFQMGFSSWDGIDSSYNSATECGVEKSKFETTIYFP